VTNFVFMTNSVCCALSWSQFKIISNFTLYFIFESHGSAYSSSGHWSFPEILLWFLILFLCGQNTSFVWLAYFIIYEDLLYGSNIFCLDKCSTCTENYVFNWFSLGS
jgi:hypothetical protein